VWVEGELNGFSRDEDVPEYRKVHLYSKGNFQGPGGAWIPKRPLPMGVLEKHHREVLDPAILSEPLASYESASVTAQGKGELVLNWAPDLIVMYQTKFIPGYALAQAWQELSHGVVIAIVDSVRNRILRFALELREELGAVSGDPKELSPTKVDQAINTYIFGGTNVIAGVAKDFTQIGTIEISNGDLVGLSNALRTLGIAQNEIELATQAVLEDGKPKDRTLGARTADWVKAVGGKLGDAGLKIGTGAATQLITKWLLQYWGL
jgi:hypothetical protein